METYTTESITVDGGQLHYRLWGTQGPLILASHGITASHVSFNILARQLKGQFRLLAVDHRGRGRSRHITGPWGMQQHAQDLIELLDQLELAQVELLLGHSMGAFIAATAGAMAPRRFPKLMFVDGGLPLFNQLPEGMTAEALIQAVIGPAMQRLNLRFESIEDYLAYWRPHPALMNDWSEEFEDYARYDLMGQAPKLYPSTKKEAVIGDVETQLIGPTIPDALQSLTQPVLMLTAARGIMNDEALYRDELISPWSSRMANFKLAQIEDVNHYTIIQSQRGAAAVQQHIMEFLA